MKPIRHIIDLDDLKITSGAKYQIGQLRLGDIILKTENFTKHDKLHGIGEIRIKVLKDIVGKTKEYKHINRYSKW